MTGRLTRVSMVCPEVPPQVVGGLGRYAERMIGQLAGAGVPVDVIGLGAGPRREQLGDVTLHRLGPLTPRRFRRPDRAGRGLRLVARNVSYSARATYRILRGPRTGSVVAVHDWMGCLTGIVCRLAGRPVVFHLHSHEMTVGTTWRTRSLLATGLAALETAQAGLATAVVVPTSTMRDLLVDRGWPAAKLRVIGHGAGDPELDRVAARPEPARRAVADRYRPGRLLVYAGRLSASKGVPTLLAAMPLLLAQLPDCTLVLCGDQSPHSDENAQVAATIERLGLAGRVVALHRFLPAADLYGHFLAADVCVFPSRYEPFGLVAVEAMALGRPVVLGPGYAPELAGDPGTEAALRCTRDSPEELATVLHRALTDEVWAAAAGERARAYVTETFRWDRTVAETLRCYAEAVRR